MVALPRQICEAAQLASSSVEQNAGLEAYTPDHRRQQGVEHTRAETYLLMTPREQPWYIARSTGQSHMTNASKMKNPSQQRRHPTQKRDQVLLEQRTAGSQETVQRRNG